MGIKRVHLWEDLKAQRKISLAERARLRAQIAVADTDPAPPSESASKPPAKPRQGKHFQVIVRETLEVDDTV